jgi:hypothetical protein
MNENGKAEIQNFVIHIYDLFNWESHNFMRFYFRRIRLNSFLFCS